MDRQRGLTLLELLIILMIVAILVTIAIPNLLGSKINANEAATHATMRTIVSSQMGFFNRREADLNGNGTGEYGTFGEMSGNIAVREASGGTRYLKPTVINPSFRVISNMGELTRSGYYYRLYLPGAAGVGLVEEPGGGASPNVDSDLAEANWCVYAWPQKFGASGRRTYFVNQSGEILFTEDANYSGPAAPLQPGAALVGPGDLDKILGAAAANDTGRDGNTWLYGS